MFIPKRMWSVLSIFFVFVSAHLFSVGAVSGNVTDSSTHQPISGVLIQALQGSTVVGSSLTDSAGDYNIPSLAAGSYSLSASQAQYRTVVHSNVVVSDGNTTIENFALLHRGNIAGVVTDAITTLPISAATVKITLGSSVVASTTTALDGSYSLLDINPGGYTITAGAANYQTVVQSVGVRSRQTTLVNFMLIPNPGVVVGVVLDASTTNPIANTSVDILQDNSLIVTAITLPDGSYEIDGLAPGSYVVRASHTGYQTALDGVIVGPNQTSTVNLSLDLLPGSISGLVTDFHLGSPIEAATIEILLDNIIVATAFTDVNGNYLISGLAPNSYNVRASASGYETDIQGAVVISDQITPVDFVLTISAGGLVGKVVDATTDLSLAGASIEVMQGITVIANTLTDENGDYIITGIAPGSYSVTATDSNHQTSVKPTSIYVNRVVTLNFALSSNPASIIGQAVDGAMNPVADVIINALINNVLVGSALTDSLGNYVLSELSAGNYNLVATGDGFGTVAKNATVLEGMTQTVDFILLGNPGAVAGAISNAATSFPVSGATLSLLDNGILIATAFTDSNGFFEADNLAPGTYLARASAPGFQTAEMMIKINPNSTTTANISIVFIPFLPQAIAGKVISNKFLTQTDRIHLITWGPSLNPDVIAYRVYQGTTFLAEILTTGPLEYIQHNQSKKIAKTYSVRSVTAFGEISDPVSITLK